MYIMVMADEPSKRLYDYFDPEQFKDVDLIISCGEWNRMESSNGLEWNNH